MSSDSERVKKSLISPAYSSSRFWLNMRFAKAVNAAKLCPRVVVVTA